MIRDYEMGPTRNVVLDFFLLVFLLDYFIFNFLTSLHRHLSAVSLSVGITHRKLSTYLLISHYFCTRTVTLLWGLLIPICVTLCFREALWCRWLPASANVCSGSQQPHWSASECGVCDGAHGPGPAAGGRYERAITHLERSLFFKMYFFSFKKKWKVNAVSVEHNGGSG